VKTKPVKRKEKIMPTPAIVGIVAVAVIAVGAVINKIRKNK
jgi:hypothetical protein